MILSLIWSIIIGFVVGWLARALLPGADAMGFWATAIVGIVGSIVGGLLGRMFRRPEPGAAFHPAGFLMSIVGAIVVLVLWRMIAR